MPQDPASGLALLILDTLPEGLAVIDKDDRVIYWNEAIEKILGWSAAEQLGRSWLNRFPDSAKTRMANLASRVRQCGRWEGELQECHRNGQALTLRGQVQSRNGLLLWELSRPTPAAMLTARIIDAIQANVAILDSAGTIVFVNDGWRRFVQANSENLPLPALVDPGTNYLDVCYRAQDEEDDARRAAEGLKGVLSGKLPKFEMEYPCHHPNGEERWFLMSASPLASEGAIIIHLDITHRHRLETALRERNEQLELALVAANMGVWLLDQNLSHLTWSPSVYSVLGVPEFDGRVSSFERLIYPEDREAALRAFAEAVESRQTFQYDFRVVSPTRGLRWMTNVARVRKDDSGLLQGVLGTVQDVTERKTTELMLSAQNRILEMVASGQRLGGVLPEIVALLEQQFPNTMASLMLADESCEFLTLAAPGKLPRGYTTRLGRVPIGPNEGSCGTAAHRGQPVGVDDIATDPLWADYRELALEHGLRSCYSWPVWSSNRDSSKVLGTFAVYFPSPDPPSTFTQALDACVAACLHLTTLAVEEERTQTALLRSEERFRDVLNASPDLVIVLDLWGRFLFVNQNAMAVLELPPKRWLGQPFEKLVPKRLHPLIEGPRACTQQGLVQTEESTPGPDGKPSHWLVRAFPLGEGPSQFYGLCINATDITAQKEAQQAHQNLEELYRQAQRMESIGKLAGGVAHDFNNILTIIVGYGELMLKELGPDHPWLEGMNQICEAARRAAGLTSQLLTFSRKAVVEPKETCLNRVVEGCAKMLRRLIGEDIELRTELLPGLKGVFIDPGQAEQVLLNLSVNARDAMPQGGVLTFASANCTVDRTLTVSTGRLEPGEYVQMRVSDTGEGIPQENLEHIFEPFFTTKSSGSGTGLGLATVYGVVHQAGGVIDVSSKPGVGSTFVIWLPALPDMCQARPGVAAQRTPGGTETVLVVEDEPSLRRLTRLALEKQGYRVLEADSGATACRKIEELPMPVDLVLTDVVMPNGSGAQVARQARQRWPGVKVLFTSGYLDDAVLRRGVELAQEPFLAKPYTPHELNQKVRQVLDSKV